MNSRFLIFIAALCLSIWSHAIHLGKQQTAPKNSLLKPAVANGTELDSSTRGAPSAWLHTVRIFTASQTCTAIFISQHHLLTAAHCLTKDYLPEKPEKVQYIIFFKGSKPVRRVELAKADSSNYLHPKYRPNVVDRAFGYDIGVVKLKSSLLQAPYRPVKLLNSQNIEKTESMVNQQALAYGGGATYHLQPVDRLLLAKVRITHFRGVAFHVKTLGKNQALCAGDSGGPLLHQSNERTILLGVLSDFSLHWDNDKKDACTEGGFYTALTPSVYRWIRKTQKK